MKLYSMALGLFLAAISANADWPAYHGGAGQAGATEERISANPERLWRVDMGSPVNATPIAVGERIYCLSREGRLAAFSLAGAALWSSVLTNESTFVAPVAYVSGTLLVASQAGTLYAVDAENGEKRWQYDAGEGVQASPVWSEEEGRTLIVLIGREDGSLHCLDLASGKLVWKIGETNRCDGSPAVADSRFVFGNCDAAIYIYSAASGDLQGKVDLGQRMQVAGGVAMAQGEAFAGTHGGSVVCVDVESSRIVWEYDGSDGPVYTTPAVDREHLVFASDPGSVYCLGRKSGELIWKAETMGPPQSPVIADDKVLVSSFGKLHIFSAADGKRLWSRAVADETTSPAIHRGMILLGSGDGNLWAFGSKNE